ncbi:polyhydroxyalkanoate depolymerase [Cupriavidus consociatus]|uniref:polyhydroxyalkanoate depolymerase n=1 Tax=Cupriavidus consociatus TaxID=2821357 RepID=UPI001AE4F41D|nr:MULTISPECIES: polyhydroxyalkanoate depolymerase [unclassified Cupriavidus]MBP0624446.1 polyhydroxyalkanoate depolymerase [Cupriavidus sp. LEh25]MDK2661157.1 polyhydroxyalkanoate depolymerase [Cupriavidus sp. LEh21]
MLYQLHELKSAMLLPLTALAQASSRTFTNPLSPLSLTPGANRLAAGYELLYRLGKDYKKPAFDIRSVQCHGREVPVVEQVIVEKPFCRLLRFKRYADDATAIQRLKNDPVVLVCAPLSGHHATLLRDTVRTLLQHHKVYVTDWVDARMVPVEDGTFHLADYVHYIQEFIRHIGADNLHVISVCQPAVPVLAAIALQASAGETTPRTMTMMGGPIDARRSPTAVNALATDKSFEWFEHNVIHTVPANYPGHGRKVYPGFLQHAGFVATNPDRHLSAHYNYYRNLVDGDLDDAAAHERFYDEYNAVLDMAAEYYLDTIRDVFQEFRLARGSWEIAGKKVRPQDIREAALLTIEGELDDITGAGQTAAAHDLCSGIPGTRKQHITAAGCGHYGIFSGRRWREEIYPQLRAFIASHG